MIELTLRDWHHDEEHADAGGSHGLPHEPLDGEAGGPTELGIHKKDTNTSNLWSCQTCTYQNAKGEAWCTMCGTSRSGRRPKDRDHFLSKKTTGTILEFCATASKRSKTAR